uniref:MARVEL domain-containing protein n=1 Tax=Aplanochytrium stocchinoi TaxID=215587 RepID=A0A7S3PGB3_9STRA|mmetsp:Transcript_10520/g.12004  ORF Transcript_10520/g.12004 Transcript_10520/m.12004 type:complete len:215 (-) Transcript_10520:120-764(-)
MNTMYCMLCVCRLLSSLTLSIYFRYWSDLNSDNVCVNGTIYDLWAKPYDFCDEIGGTFDRGSYIKAIEAFVVLTLIFATFAACAGCSVRSSGSKGLYGAACFSFLTWLSAVVAFSIMVSSDNKWYHDLRSSSGTYIPMITNTGVIVPYPVKNFWFGPTFGMLITIFIVSLIAHCTLQGAALKIDAELQRRESTENFNTDEIDYAESGKPVMVQT